MTGNLCCVGNLKRSRKKGYNFLLLYMYYKIYYMQVSIIESCNWEMTISFIKVGKSLMSTLSFAFYDKQITHSINSRRNSSVE